MNRLLDIDRVLDEWLVLGPEQLPDEVLDRVAIDIDDAPQRRSAWTLESPSLNRLLFMGTVAAAVVAVIVGLSIIGGRNIGGPEPTPTALPLLPVEAANQVLLDPGSYEVQPPFPARISFSLPSGWHTYAVDENLAAVCKGPECDLGLSFWVLDNLPLDACQPALGDKDPAVGPMVDDLATALVAQGGYAATGPTDASMSGFNGAYLELVGLGVPDGTCYRRTTWTIGPQWRRSLPGEADRIWILDVGGIRLVVDAFAVREATEGDRAELGEMVTSIQIEVP